MSAVLEMGRADARELKRSLRMAQYRNRMVALGLIAPLAVFLVVVFALPVVTLLKRAVENPEVVQALPHTAGIMQEWNGQDEVPAAAYKALLKDFENDDHDRIGPAAGRLNRAKPGFRALFSHIAEALPIEGVSSTAPAALIQQKLVELDERWAHREYWWEIKQNSSRYTSAYLLTALDYKKDDHGRIVPVAEGASNYQDIFGRTFVISLVVTLCTLVLGYPLAYWISRMPAQQANLVMILVLLPFWTSILVRISSWMVLLQSQGLVNKALLALGVVTAPLELLFNRTGVVISMTHILLPFMVLPLYSVMKSIPPTFQRAAVSLGSHPFAAFWKVYVPQTLPGVSAGTLLVFILALGYYITPALLGGPSDQMVSYYVAYFTNVMVNWGLACALGALLLAATLVLFVVYRRVGGGDIKMG